MKENSEGPKGRCCWADDTTMQTQTRRCLWAVGRGLDQTEYRWNHNEDGLFGRVVNRRTAEHLLLLVNTQKERKKKLSRALSHPWTGGSLHRVSVLMDTSADHSFHGAPEKTWLSVNRQGGFRVDKAFRSTRSYSPNCPKSETACTYSYSSVPQKSGPQEPNYPHVRAPTKHWSSKMVMRILVSMICSHIWLGSSHFSLKDY
jgi:hypothetical protein